MRRAMSKEQQGEALTAKEREYLKQYRLIEEYSRVAPLIPSSTYGEIYRGIGISAETQKYAYSLKGLKVGDKWDVDKMPTSFTTKRDVANVYAFGKESNGIIIHIPTGKLTNAPSIKGISAIADDNEVLLSDYSWKVSRIVDSQQDDYYHIYLDK